MRFLWLFISLNIITFNVSANDDLKPYPATDNGYERFAIHLPQIPNESDHQIEIMIGKEMLVDCNQHSFSGKVEEKTVNGWGYTYYSVSNITDPASTMMACPDAKKQNAFVNLNNKDNLFQRYSSKLPIIIYVPLGFEVRYRVWTAESTVHDAAKE